ncbi:MAG: hypothetical protein K0R38_7157, partial [Polyangiaceae bacterium]|nr:hypothetical protein [Polyangiaceae bacterium]
MSRAERTFRSFAAADVLVLSYLVMLNLAVALAKPNPLKTQCQLQVLGLLLTCVVCLLLVRGSA